MAHISFLPAELVAIVSDLLCSDLNDLNYLARTCRRLHDLVNPRLYIEAVEHSCFRAPFLAAQDGIFGTMERLMNAGLANHIRSFQQPDFVAQVPISVGPLELGRWAGSTGSINDVVHYACEVGPYVLLKPAMCSKGSISGGADCVSDSNSFFVSHRLRMSRPTIPRDVSARDYSGTSDLFVTPNCTAFLPELPTRFPRPSLFGPSISAQENVTWSPLHAASANGHLRIIEILLDNGFDINAPSFAYCWCESMQTYATDACFPPPSIRESTNSSGHHYGQFRLWTPLHHAICHGQNEAAMMLLRRGAAVSLEALLTLELICRYGTTYSEKKNPVTALHLAAGLGELDLVKFIVDSGFQTNLEIEDEQCLTPVLWAFKNGHYSTTVSWLLSRGANINFKPRDCAHNAFLCSSIDYGHYEQASRLLDLGARPDRQMFLAVDSTLLHKACCGAIQLGPDDLSYVRLGFRPFRKVRREESLQSRLEQYSNHTEKQRLQLIKKLLGVGAILDSSLCYDYTPFELAVKYHLIGAAECLLASGAKIRLSSFVRTITDCLTIFEKRPSQLPSSVMDMFQLLIAHKVEGMPRTDMLGKCLHILLSMHPRDSLPDLYAVDCRPDETFMVLSVDIVQLLLRRGASPGFCDLSDYTAFKHACDRGAFSAAKVMLISGYRPSSWEIGGIVLQSMENHDVPALKFALGLRPDILNTVTLPGKCLLSLLRRRPACLKEILGCLMGADSCFLIELYWKSTSELLETLGWACTESHVPTMNVLIRSEAIANLATKPAIMSWLLGNVLRRRRRNFGHRSRLNALRAAKLLLQAGADALMDIKFEHAVALRLKGEPKPADFIATSAIGLAIDQKDFEAVDMILNHCPQIFRPIPRLACLNFLHYAVRNILRIVHWDDGSDSAVRTYHVITRLVRSGVDPSATDRYGCSSLAYLMQICAEIYGDCEVDIPDDAIPHDATELFTRLTRLLWYEEVDVSVHSKDCDSIQESLQKLQGNGAEVQEAEDSPQSFASPSIVVRRALADAVVGTVRIAEGEGGKKVLELLPDDGRLFLSSRFMSEGYIGAN